MTLFVLVRTSGSFGKLSAASYLPDLNFVRRILFSGSGSLPAASSRDLPLWLGFSARSFVETSRILFSGSGSSPAASSRDLPLWLGFSARSFVEGSTSLARVQCP